MENAESYNEEANMAIDLLKEFIHVENQLVTSDHELEEKLYSLDYIIAHLDEGIPQEAEHLHELNGLVSDGLLEIRDFVEENRLNELEIVKESKEILSNLEKDVEHRDWVALKKELDDANPDLKKSVRLEKQELKELHTKIISLMKVMKRSKLIKALEKDLIIEKLIEEFEKKEEYYFMQIYKFLRAYERIFRHLWRKEKILAKKIKKTSKKIM